MYVSKTLPGGEWWAYEECTTLEGSSSDLKQPKSPPMQFSRDMEVLIQDDHV